MNKASTHSKVVSVKYKDLLDGVKRDLEDLIIDKNIQLKQDIETGEYHAHLKVENPKKKIVKSRSQMILKKRDVVPHEHFQKKIPEPKPQAIKTQKIITENSTIQINEGRIVQPKKIQILTKFQACFPSIDFEAIFFHPLYLQRPIFYQKMELYYNRLFEIILRTKNFTEYTTSRIMLIVFKEELKQNFNSAHQNLLNFLYTSDKNFEFSEVAIFIQFLFEKRCSPALLFYLYTRQVIKIVTCQFFLFHKPNDLNPKNFKLKKEEVFKILYTIFSFDPSLALKSKQHFFKRTKPDNEVVFYDFVVHVNSMKFDFEV